MRDLRRNLEINHLDNVDVIGGDAVREFPDEDADVLIVDPPRAGLAPEAIDLIASTSARDVAYVSNHVREGNHVCCCHSCRRWL